MIKSIIGKKIGQTQEFDTKGKRIPVTLITAGPCPVVQIKTKEKDGYDSLQIGFGVKNKKISKPLSGHFKKVKLTNNPQVLKEVDFSVNEDGSKSVELGKVYTVSDIFKTSDLVNIKGVSKGKGFAGVVKRHHFKGGPRTHGQSDRERAPGSIGQTTTPGRVYKGKRMAGRMGGQPVTVKNLTVVRIEPEKNLLVVKGLVPGFKNELLMIEKV